MLLTGYLENLVPLPDPSILSSYTVSLNLKIKKNLQHMIIMGSKHHFISYVSADFVLSNLDSIKFPPSRSQLMVLMTWIYDSHTLLLH